MNTIHLNEGELLGSELKEYDIIITKYSKTWKYVLNVSKSDIVNGVDVNEPGLWLFYGMWYGTNTKDINSFGKIEYINPNTVYTRIIPIF